MNSAMQVAKVREQESSQWKYHCSFLADHINQQKLQLQGKIEVIYFLGFISYAKIPN